jgi:hypothetical protein
MQDLSDKLKSLFMNKKRWENSIKEVDIRCDSVQDLSVERLVLINEWLAKHEIHMQFHKTTSINDPNALTVLRAVAVSWADYLCSVGPVNPVDKIPVCSTLRFLYLLLF